MARLLFSFVENNNANCGTQGCVDMRFTSPERMCSVGLMIWVSQGFVGFFFGV